MTANRQRLAWALVLASFFTCLAITIAVPVGYAALRERARAPLTLRVQTNQGTLGVISPQGDRNFLAVTDPPQEVLPPMTLITGRNDTGLLEIFSPDETQFVARLQLYGDSFLVVDRAAAPRFNASSLPHQLSLNLISGRLRLIQPPDADARPLGVNLQTPHGWIEIRQPGQYAVEASNTSSLIAVLSGEATLHAGEATLPLASNQLGVLDNVGLHGPASTERNLLLNGAFTDDLNHWIVGAWRVERPEEPSGETQLALVNDEPVLRLKREGIGHADISITQLLDQDVTDFQSLRLSLTMRFQQQSLPVCGSLGTECPLTVRLEYDDIFGQAQAWQQGIYAQGVPSTDAPDICVVCGPPLNLNRHWPANGLNQVVFFDSDNLLERLEQEGIRPSRIKSVSLIAAGHTFEVDVIEVALLAQE